MSKQTKVKRKKKTELAKKKKALQKAAVRSTLQDLKLELNFNFLDKAAITAASRLLGKDLQTYAKECILQHVDAVFASLKERSEAVKKAKEEQPKEKETGQCEL